VTSMREHRRYLRGMFAWVGFSQTGVRYKRDPRHRGETKFSLRKMLTFATDGIVSFSAVPLRIALNMGFLVSVATFTLGFVAILLKLTGVYAAPGWASIVVAIAFLGGVQLTVLGVIGEYIARIHEEVKQRPLYLLRDQIGFQTDRLSDTPRPSRSEFLTSEPADPTPARG
jgi:polyisoprenyl-phosphate glycosyltransferase